MEQAQRVSKRIGVVGRDVMGSALGQRLMQCGHMVSVTSRRHAAASFLEAGAHWTHSANALASSCEVVIVGANNASQVESIAFGENGLAGAHERGLLIIDMSTISAGRNVAFAARAADLGVVGAPLSDGAPAAHEGRLTLFLGEK